MRSPCGANSIRHECHELTRINSRVEAGERMAPTLPLLHFLQDSGFSLQHSIILPPAFPAIPRSAAPRRPRGAFVAARLHAPGGARRFPSSPPGTRRRSATNSRIPSFCLLIIPPARIPCAGPGSGISPLPWTRGFGTRAFGKRPLPPTKPTIPPPGQRRAGIIGPAKPCEDGLPAKCSNGPVPAFPAPWTSQDRHSPPGNPPRDKRISLSNLRACVSIVLPAGRRRSPHFAVAFVLQKPHAAFCPQKPRTVQQNCSVAIPGNRIHEELAITPMGHFARLRQPIRCR